MSLKISYEEECLFSVYNDDTEWFMSPNKKQHPKYGVCGDDIVFFFDRNGLLELCSFKQKRRIHCLSIGPSIQYDGKVASSLFDILQTFDDRFILILQRNGLTRNRILTVVDAVAGKVFARYDKLPDGLLRVVHQLENGSLVIPVNGTFEGDIPTQKTIPEGGELKTGFMEIDPMKGLTKLSVQSAPRGVGRFHSPSPNGRYWLKSNTTSLPFKTFQIPVEKRRLFGKKYHDKTYYGLSVQLWETFPLKFVRNLIVGWYEESNLSDAGCKGSTTQRRKEQGLPPVRGAIFERVANILDAEDLKPLEVLSSDVINSKFTDEQEHIKSGDYPYPSRIYSDFYELIDHSKIVWQDDQNFTISGYEFDSIINVEGMKPPQPAALQVLDKSDLNESPDADISINDEKAKRQQRAVAHMKKQSTLTIPMASMSETDCISAIELLTKQLDEDLPFKAYNSEIKIVFKFEKKRINEKTFFDHVYKNGPSAIPALRNLITQYHACTGEWDYIYSSSTNGDEFLGVAARTLGLMDEKSMDVVQLFAERIDPSHQYTFCRKTLPAIIKQQGMTDDVLRLSIWVMLFKSGNSVEPKDVWNKYGVKKALEVRPVREAVALFNSVKQSETDKKFEELAAGDFLGSMTGALGISDDKWSQAFFSSL